MNILLIILTAIGLSMDSFAASFTSGGLLPRFTPSRAARIALSMAFFQGIMSVIGWILGLGFREQISDYDHWIAFIMLAIIGGKMILDAFRPQEEKQFDPLQLKILIVLSIATSIDAWAVGLSFAVLSVNIGIAIGIIALVTFLISYMGVYAGSLIRQKLPINIEAFGGVILILIGLKIILEHTQLL